MNKIIIKFLILSFFLIFSMAYATDDAVKALGIQHPNPMVQQFKQFQQQQQVQSTSAVTPAVQGPRPSDITMDSQSTYGNILQQSEQVFGENMFRGSCKLPDMTSFNPDYRVTVGDKISVQLWGAFTFNQTLPVDSQGNIFIPEVGPVHVLGVENKNLNKIIFTSLKQVFKKDVGSYANLLTAQPVQVYVTGFVKNPGLYAGLSSDSIIYFLCKAGGVNPEEGSFRNILILRNARVLHRIDLYNFLLNGRLQQFQMHQGDTIVVKPIMNTIKVFGQVDNQYQFEFTTPSITMKQLERYAGVKPNVTYVRIQKNQGVVPTVKYLPSNLAQNYKLLSGDVVTFVSDQQPNRLSVTIAGQVVGPHEFVVKRGTTLAQLMNKVHYTHQASVPNTQLYRQSTAIQQKQAILTSLNSLQKRIVFATAATAEGAQIQTAQAKLLMSFIQRARKVQPKGQVVLTGYRSWQNVVLQNNDVINVPEETNVITISGQVLTPTSVTLDPRFSVNDYIRAAGGFTSTADRSRVLILHQNGQVQIVTGNVLFGIHNVRIYGGDQIIVEPKPYKQHLQIATAITQILYQIAVATRVAVDF